MSFFRKFEMRNNQIIDIFYLVDFEIVYFPEDTEKRYQIIAISEFYI